MGASAVHQIITDKIVALIEQGIVPWRRPWRTAGGGNALYTNRPINGDGRPYHGINFLILATEAMVKGYGGQVWLTFNKARELGGCVRKGEKSTMVTLWQPTEKLVEQPDGSMKKTKQFFLRYYNVFNVEQCDGVTLPKKLRPVDVETPAEPQPVEVSIAACEAIVAGMPNPPVIHREVHSARAFYMPSADSVTVPDGKDFESGEEYYSTLFHELGHSTGAKSRLDRKDFGGTGSGAFSWFGSPVYSREELVAELTAAFLCAEAGVDNVTIENSAAYIANWSQALRDDPTVVVQAAGQAQKAANYILNIEPEKYTEEVAA
jgi:antirestriction protein ArdC